MKICLTSLLSITILLTPFKSLWKFAKKYFCNVDNFYNFIVINPN